MLVLNKLVLSHGLVTLQHKYNKSKYTAPSKDPGLNIQLENLVAKHPKDKATLRQRIVQNH